MDIFDSHTHKDRILYELQKQLEENFLYSEGAFKSQEDGYDDKKRQENKEKRLKVPDVNL